MLIEKHILILGGGWGWRPVLILLTQGEGRGGPKFVKTCWHNTWTLPESFVVSSVRYGAWYKDKKEQSLTRTTPRIICFVVGGTTFSEMRVAYEVTQEKRNWEVIMGEQFIQANYDEVTTQLYWVVDFVNIVVVALIFVAVHIGGISSDRDRLIDTSWGYCCFCCWFYSCWCC